MSSSVSSLILLVHTRCCLILLCFSPSLLLLFPIKNLLFHFSYINFLSLSASVLFIIELRGLGPGLCLLDPSYAQRCLSGAFGLVSPNHSRKWGLFVCVCLFMVMVVLVVNIFQMRKQTLKNTALPRPRNKVQSRVQIQSPLLYFYFQLKVQGIY